LALDESARLAFDARLSGLPGGWILRRTAGEVPEDDLMAEIQALAAAGARVRAGLGVDAPDAFRRLAADYGIPSPSAVAVSGAAAERTARKWCADFAPSLLPCIARHDGRGPGLFDLHDLDAEIDALARPSVALPDGGSLVIEATVALTAIDVNAGAQANALSVNLAAASEIARQLRLRHIGGIVVIDFVSLARARDRAGVMAALAAALATDPAQTHILPMSAFGLVEMTRERRGPGLEPGN
jgi:ribonuclease E/ribonuclease G